MFTSSGLTSLSNSVEACILFNYPLCVGNDTALSSDLSYINDQNGVCFPNTNIQLLQLCVP